MTEPPRQFGRYVLCDEIAAGGMASVHLGRLTGPAGFARTVAIKRLHARFARSPEFVAMLLDEARLAARIRHPNVVSTLDVIATDGELLIVMDYVEGESFSHLQRICSARGAPVSLNVVSAVLVQALLGLHAAHEALDENGHLLHLVHRDVSPQNLLVGTDGTTRVLDFGVAKARFRLQTTDDGAVKGKLGYMAPEQLLHNPIDRRADLFAAGIVLWEALTGKRLFANTDTSRLVSRILTEAIRPPSHLRPDVTPELDALVARALHRDPEERFQTAREMALALDAVLPPASTLEVGSWVEAIAKETLDHRARRVAHIERNDTSSSSVPDLREILSSDPEIAEEPSEETTQVAAAGLISLRPGVLNGRPSAPSIKRRRWRAAALIGSVVAALALLFVARALLTSMSQQPSRDPAASPPASAAPTAIESSATQGVATQPSSSSPSQASAAPVIAPPLARPAAPAKRRSPCNPPYVVDRTTGIKRYKAECF